MVRRLRRGRGRGRSPSPFPALPTRRVRAADRPPPRSPPLSRLGASWAYVPLYSQALSGAWIASGPAASSAHPSIAPSLIVCCWGALGHPGSPPSGPGADLAARPRHRQAAHSWPPVWTLAAPTCRAAPHDFAATPCGSSARHTHRSLRTPQRTFWPQPPPLTDPAADHIPPAPINGRASLSPRPPQHGIFHRSDDVQLRR